ncbi:hypothetical protein B0H10DRAFT_55827 [Mycena sp. CBHHK59/15]|nr:hypothetical protein B0H10DRAFT_55827 [Mycena sp. CBHHK59/15]
MAVFLEPLSFRVSSQILCTKTCMAPSQLLLIALRQSFHFRSSHRLLDSALFLPLHSSIFFRLTRAFKYPVNMAVNSAIISLALRATACPTLAAPLPLPVSYGARAALLPEKPSMTKATSRGTSSSRSSPTATRSKRNSRSSSATSRGASLSISPYLACRTLTSRRREHEGGLAGRGLFDVLTKLLRNKKLLLGGGGRKKRALADLSDAEVVLLLEYVNEMSTTGNETAIVESIAGEAQSYNDLD